MPPDQLDVAASRRLEPQQRGRWRSVGKGSSSTASGTVGGAGAFSASKADDGASRRGRYQLAAMC